MAPLALTTPMLVVRGHSPERPARDFANHPYELPEVLAVPVESGYQLYLDWLTGETK